MNAKTYTIAFSQQRTIATSFGALAQDNLFYLKAIASNRKSRQHVGYARIVSPKQIVVTTVSGVIVGTAASRAQAIAMIDTYHRTHNAQDYGMWINDTLLIRGKPVTEGI